MISIKKDFNDIPPILLNAKDGDQSWNHVSVLEKLKEIYHGKCAYCETKTDDLVIDHYRPQKNYPWLENEWSNLLLSCKGCKDARENKTDTFPVKERLQYDDSPNNKHKQITISPLRDEDKRADSDFLLSEKPLLLHPEIDTVENHFYFEEDGEMLWNSEKGQKTISTFNLNRSDLKERRKEKYDYFSNWLLQIIKGEKEITKLENLYEELSRSTSFDEEFSLIGQQMYFQFENFVWEKVCAAIALDTDNYDPDKAEDGYLSEVLKSDIEMNEDITIGYFFKYASGLNRDYTYKDWLLELKLPVSISGFKIQNFQGIKNLEIEKLPLGTQWIFLTGENGFGKTSLLRGILLGLIGTSELKPSDYSERTRIGVQIADKLDHYKFTNLTQTDKITFNIQASNTFKNYGNLVAAYGSKRTDLRPDNEDQATSDNLFDKTNFVLNIQETLKTFDGDIDLQAFRVAIIDCLKKLIPKLHDIEFSKHPDLNIKHVRYIEKDDDGNKLDPVSFEQLAMGMRGIIGLIGDIILRLSKTKKFFAPNSDPWTDTSFKKSIESISELSGIVIIDEIDIHLHAKWQRLLVEKLTEIFPNVQFIVSTHSPIPLLGAPPERTVILNINRTKEDGITARRLEKLEKEFKYLLPNQLLTSSIFGLDEIEHSNLTKEELDEIPVEDKYEEIEENRKMMDELKELSINKELFPDDLFKK